jgi:hypothetical protein
VAPSRFCVGIAGDLTAHDREQLEAAGVKSEPDFRVGRFRRRSNSETEASLADLDEMTPVAVIDAPNGDEAIRCVAEVLGRPPVGFIAWDAKSEDQPDPT